MGFYNWLLVNICCFCFLVIDCFAVFWFGFVGLLVIWWVAFVCFGRCVFLYACLVRVYVGGAGFGFG